MIFARAELWSSIGLTGLICGIGFGLAKVTAEGLSYALGFARETAEGLSYKVL